MLVQMQEGWKLIQSFLSVPCQKWQWLFSWWDFLVDETLKYTYVMKEFIAHVKLRYSKPSLHFFETVKKTTASTQNKKIVYFDWKTEAWKQIKI